MLGTDIVLYPSHSMIILQAADETNALWQEAMLYSALTRK